MQARWNKTHRNIVSNKFIRDLSRPQTLRFRYPKRFRRGWVGTELDGKVQLLAGVGRDGGNVGVDNRTT